MKNSPQRNEIENETVAMNEWKKKKSFRHGNWSRIFVAAATFTWCKWQLLVGGQDYKCMSKIMYKDVDPVNNLRLPLYQQNLQKELWTPDPSQTAPQISLWIYPQYKWLYSGSHQSRFDKGDDFNSLCKNNHHQRNCPTTDEKLIQTIWTIW